MERTKPTLLDFAILGLLRLEGMTGYRIRKTFEETAMGNYSSSPGTIYPALKRLQNHGLIKKETDVASSKVHMVITPVGKAKLLTWLTGPVDMVAVEKRREELFLRFAFMDIVEDRNQVVHFLETFRDVLSKHISELLQYHQTQGAQLPLFGRLAFEEGIESAKANLKWCKRAIREIS